MLPNCPVSVIIDLKHIRNILGLNDAHSCRRRTTHKEILQHKSIKRNDISTQTTRSFCIVSVNFSRPWSTGEEWQGQNCQPFELVYKNSSRQIIPSKSITSCFLLKRPQGLLLLFILSQVKPLVCQLGLAGQHLLLIFKYSNKNI